MKTMAIIVFTLSLICAALVVANPDGEGDSLKIVVHTGDSVMTLDDLSWLAGRWVGDGWGGIFEEVWNPPLGGSLTGSFKHVVDGKPAFYELMTIIPGPQGPTLRLKHFNPDLTGWEEKDEVITFDFVGGGKNEIRFDGLSYARNADTLQIKVATKNEEGKVVESTIECRRMPL